LDIQEQELNKLNERQKRFEQFETTQNNIKNYLESIINSKVKEMNSNIDEMFNKMMVFVNSSNDKVTENFGTMKETFKELIKQSVIKKKTDKNMMISAIKDEITTVKKQFQEIKDIRH